jgi:cytochrome c oxidase subunit 4
MLDTGNGMNRETLQTDHGHPTVPTYVKIAVILAVVTLLEVIIFFVDFLQGVLIPLLLVLSTGKFILVAMFYMHLRFDNRLFSGLFVGGLFIATAMLIALMGLFGVIGGEKGPVIASAPPTESTGVVDLPETTGAELFIQTGCGACHTISGVSGAIGEVGPSLDGIGVRAATRKPGINAEKYIRESIENPTDFVVQGFSPVMPNLRGDMTQKEFESIVDYLVTLK